MKKVHVELTKLLKSRGEHKIIDLHFAEKESKKVGDEQKSNQKKKKKNEKKIINWQNQDSSH